MIGVPGPYGLAVEALANMSIPSFAGLDPTEVAEAFGSAFPADDPIAAFLPNGEWLASFVQDVSAKSGGRVILRLATDAELPAFGPLVKGPAAYLVLSDRAQTRYVVLVPGYPPLVERG